MDDQFKLVYERGSTSQFVICKECGNQAKFSAEVFGTLCPSCGTVQEEELVLIPSGLTDSKSKKDVFISGKKKSITQAKVAEHHKNRIQADQDNFKKMINKQDKQRLINGILSAFGHSSYKKEVQSILFQAHIAASSSKVELEREVEDDDTDIRNDFKDILGHTKLDSAICAACFIVINKHSTQITLASVCESADQNLKKVTRSLNNLEKIFSSIGSAKGAEFEFSRQTAALHFDSQIEFLIRQRNLPIDQRIKGTLFDLNNSEKTSLLTKADKIYLSRANLESTSFRSMANEMAKLCADKGLNNRVGKRGIVFDLGICSWAILMLTIEAQTGEPCSEKRFAQLAAWAPGWRIGKKLGGYTKSQLGFANVHSEGSEGSSFIDDDKEESMGDEDESDLDAISIDQARRTAINTVAALVHSKYHAICKLLSLYIQHLPWFEKSENEPKKGSSTRAKKARKTVDRRNINRDSDDVLPRSTIVQHINEVLKLRALLDEKVEKAFKEKNGLSLSAPAPSSKLWDEKSVNQEVSKDPTSNSQSNSLYPDHHSYEKLTMFKNLYDALFALPIEFKDDNKPIDQRSELTKSIGPSLLTLASLQEMDSLVVDRLLFRDEELNDYLCSSDEVKLKQIALGYDVNSAEQQTINAFEDTEGKQNKNSIPTPISKLHPFRTRTKARNEVEIEKILSSL